MDFGKRLSLLMNVLGITNNSLAKALSVDPSLVSRWRSGSRTPAKDSHYVEEIARYVVDHIRMEHEKLALCEITGCVPEVLDRAAFLEIVTKWLLEAPMPDTRLIGSFLDKVGLFKVPLAEIETIDIPLHGQRANFEVFYGTEGKQRGVMKFLSFALLSKEPGTLLLYSDESVDWFLSNRNYALQLNGILIQLTKRGWKINMVHTMSRDISEMLGAIDFWLPLYMSGFVIPYYNPRYREHYFRRTLFVVPKIAAFNCSAFEGFQHGAVNLLTTEKQIVELFEEEYNKLLGTCRPLMKIPQIGSQEIFELLEDFEEQGAPSFLMTDGLPFVTMPAEIIEKILRRSSLEPEQIISHWRKRSTFFERNLKDHSCVHILTLPELEQIRSKKVYVELTVPDCEVPYSLEEYARHLEHLIYLMERYQNYHLCISSRSIHANVHVAVKDQVGVTVLRKDRPVKLFAINHPDMTNAFYCYAEDHLNRLPRESKDKESVIRTLKRLIEDFSKD